jgi:hypothetical protein
MAPRVEMDVDSSLRCQVCDAVSRAAHPATVDRGRFVLLPVNAVLVCRVALCVLLWRWPVVVQAVDGPHAGCEAEEKTQRGRVIDNGDSNKGKIAGATISFTAGCSLSLVTIITPYLPSLAVSITPAGHSRMLLPARMVRYICMESAMDPVFSTFSPFVV